LRRDIDRVLDRVEIGGPGAKRPVARETSHLAGLDADKHRKLLRALGLEPSPMRLRFPRLVIVGRGGVDDRLVVDRQDRLEIVRAGFTHIDHQRLLDESKRPGIAIRQLGGPRPLERE